MLRDATIALKHVSDHIDLSKQQAEKLKSCEMKDECWKMKDEGWKMKEECWKMKD